MAAVAPRRAAGLARATATAARVLWADLSACDADDYDDFGPDVVEGGEVPDGGAAFCTAPGVAPTSSAVAAGRGKMGKLAVGRTASSSVKEKHNSNGLASLFRHRNISAINGASPSWRKFIQLRQRHHPNRTGSALCC